MTDHTRLIDRDTLKRTIKQAAGFGRQTHVVASGDPLAQASNFSVVTESMMVGQSVSDGNVMLLQTASPKSQLGLRFSALVIICGPTFLFLAVTVWANFYADVPIGFFSRDPMASLNGHPLTGIQSILGVLVWCVAAGVCLFTCFVLQGTQVKKNLCLFLLWSGVISAVLALDDMFLFHEDLAHRYLSLNEKVVLLAYGSLVVWYVTKFRRNILVTEYLLLLLAFAFFGSSIVIDFFQSSLSSSWRIFFEDGFKLLGIVTWSGYLIRTCFQAMAAQLALRSQP